MPELPEVEIVKQSLSKKIERKKIKKIIITNRNLRFKIPLKFGYKLINKGKFNMGIETALIFSTLLNSEIPNAEFNYPEYTLINIEDKTPERVDINLQFAISLRFNYKLANSISLSAQPEFTKYLNSIYDVNKGGPNTKPYTMGLRIGIFYDF